MKANGDKNTDKTISTRLIQVFRPPPKPELDYSEVDDPNYKENPRCKKYIEEGHRELPARMMLVKEKNLFKKIS